jgi:hypothetical protein
MLLEAITKLYQLQQKAKQELDGLALDSMLKSMLET